MILPISRPSPSSAVCSAGYMLGKKGGSSLVAQLVKNPPAKWETWVRSLSWEDPLEKGMGTHSSILALRIPMGRGAWWFTDRGVAESDITERLSTHTHTHTHTYLLRWCSGKQSTCQSPGPEDSLE